MTTTLTPASSSLDECPPAPILAAIAAAVATVFGPNASITHVQPAPTSLEALTEALTQQLWSLEGRRQIYTSHTVR